MVNPHQRAVPVNAVTFLVYDKALRFIRRE
jgi:hypothetical protein